MTDVCLCASRATLCALCSAQRAADLSAWRLARAAEERLAPLIADHAERRWGPRLLAHAVRDFRIGEHSRESLERTLTAFAPWFGFTWLPNWTDDLEDIETDIPADWPTTSLGVTWLASAQSSASPWEQVFTVTAAESPYSFWVVEAVRPGWLLVVRDLLTGRRVGVVDPEISARARPADTLLSAVVTVDQVSTFLGPVSHTLPSAWRGDTKEFRHCYSEEGWLTRAELVGMDWELLGEYRSAYDEWPSYGLDPAEETLDPLTLRWELVARFDDVLEALRPLSVWDDDEAVEAEYCPDGTPQVLLTWSEAGAVDDDPYDRRMIGYLYLDPQTLVADVPCRSLADRLVTEVTARVGDGARLIESRPSMPIRVHSRGPRLPSADALLLS